MERARWISVGAAAAGVAGVIAILSHFGKAPAEEPPFVVVSRAASVTAHARAFVARDAGTSRDLHALSASGAHLYAAGAGGTLLHLADPTRGFVALASGTTRDLYAVHASSALVVAVGAGGTIVRAGEDGAWGEVPSGVAADLYAVAAEETTREVVAVGAGGAVVHGTALSWAPEASGTSRALRGVAFAAGAAYAVGDDGVIAVRPAAGERWRLEPSGTTRDLLAITAVARAGGGATLVAVGAAGTVLLKSVGADAGSSAWIAAPAVTDEELRAVAGTEAAVHATGRGGVVVRVDPVRGSGSLETRGEGADLDAIAVRLGEVYAAGAGGVVLARELF